MVKLIGDRLIFVDMRTHNLEPDCNCNWDKEWCNVCEVFFDREFIMRNVNETDEAWLCRRPPVPVTRVSDSEAIYLSDREEVLRRLRADLLAK